VRSSTKHDEDGGDIKEWKGSRQKEVPSRREKAQKKERPKNYPTLRRRRHLQHSKGSDEVNTPWQSEGVGKEKKGPGWSGPACIKNEWTWAESGAGVEERSAITTTQYSTVKGEPERAAAGCQFEIWDRLRFRHHLRAGYGRPFSCLPHSPSPFHRNKLSETRKRRQPPIMPKDRSTANSEHEACDDALSCVSLLHHQSTEVDL